MHRPDHPTRRQEAPPTMSILDRPPPRPACPAHLDVDHAHVLLDALCLAEQMIERSHQPWTEYGDLDPVDPKTTDAGYLDLFAAAVEVLLAVVDTEPAPLLVRHTPEDAHTYAAFNPR